MGFTDRQCEKEDKVIRVCADFSTGLNAALKDYRGSLPSPEEIFVFSRIQKYGFKLK